MHDGMGMSVELLRHVHLQKSDVEVVPAPVPAAARAGRRRRGSSRV